MNPIRLHIDPGLPPTVDVRGDLCISSVALLETCVLRLAALRPGTTVLLDLRAVSFCDVTALRCLWRVRGTARELGVEIDLRPSPAIARLERLVGSLGADRAA
jgi:anti-anti-sigma regulatory factor